MGLLPGRAFGRPADLQAEIRGEDAGLDFPASVAFGTGKGVLKSVFLTNFAIGSPGGAFPGVLQVDTG